MRLSYNIGKYGTWGLLILAAIGGVGSLVSLAKPAKTVVTFVNPEGAKALAIRAAKVDVTIWSGETKQDRDKAFQEFGWKTDDFTANGTTVSVNQATVLAPKILSATQEVVPVMLYETVQQKNGDAQVKKQIANVLILADAKGNLTVGGAPWIENTDAKETPDAPKTDMDTTTIQPVIDQFLTAWFRGDDITNQVADTSKLPSLPFQSQSVKIQQLYPLKNGQTGAEVVTNLTALDPATNVSMPMQLIFLLQQTTQGKWIIEQVIPY